MRRWVPVVLLTAVLVVPGALAGDWTQSGHDPARTDHAPEPGPATNDTAFEVDLPGGSATAPAVGQGPLVLDGQAYVPVRPVGPEDLNLTANGLARVDLDTAEVSMVVTLDDDEEVQGTAADRERVYLATGQGMMAYERSGFEHVWSWELPNPVDGQDEAQDGTESQRFCGAPAVSGARVYVGCVVFRGATAQGSLAALDAETGQGEWIWNTTDDPAAGSPEAQMALLLGFSVIDDQVLVTRLSQAARPLDDDNVPVDDPGLCEVCDTEGYTAKRNVSVLALDADDGTLDWSHGRTTTYTQAEAADQTLTPPSQSGLEDIEGQTWQPPGTPAAAYVKLGDRVKALNLGQQGEVIWDQPVGEEDTVTGAGDPAGAALAGDRLFMTSITTLYRFDTERQVIDGSTLLPPERNQAFTRGELILAGEILYAGAAQRFEDRQPDGTRLYAFDASSLEIRWERHLPRTAWASDYGVDVTHHYSVADGVLVAASLDGKLTVIGKTEASLGAPELDTDRYPEAGETVTVDASSTEPGAFGEATRYMVDWGDGSISGWQASPTFTHTYEDEETYQAQIYAGNDANQTSSTAVTMRVGQEEPTWLSERFAEGNQDMTFGVIGVALALGGGAIGVARRRRKRSNLEAELEALEEGFEELEDKPGECEAFLDNRKARARSLAIDGYLEEQHVPVIESRAEELRGQLRTSMLDERFQFLPHGMVQSLKRMLADGQINAWERDTIETLLEEDEALNAAQKERVRGLLERWSGSSGSAEEGTRA